MDETYLHGSQDMTFHAKVLLEKPVYVSSECWDRYRIHPESFWGRLRQQGLFVEEGQPHVTAERFLTWLEAYLRERAISSGPVWQALQKALWPYRHPYLFRLKTHLTPPYPCATRRAPSIRKNHPQ